jgi:hypothetical protein
MKEDGGFYLPLFLHVATVAHAARIWISDTGMVKAMCACVKFIFSPFASWVFYSQSIWRNKMQPNTARTRRVGVCAFSNSFLGLKLVPAKWRCLIPPTSG